MWKIVALLVAAAAVQALGDADSTPHINPRQAISPHNIRDDRISGGKEAAPGQFPHQVAIFITQGRYNVFCGGSIISERVILTTVLCTPHVFYDEDEDYQFWVVAGAHQINANEASQQRVNVSEFLIHEHFGLNFRHSENIALLYLARPLVLNERVQPVRLPTKEQANNSFWRYKATVSGWGQRNRSDWDSPSTLRYMESRVVTNLYCEARYFDPDIFHTQATVVADTNICVSGLGAKGICQGDQGGPLIIKDTDGKPTIVGLADPTTLQDCDASYPPVFTRVSSYIDWIESGIQKLSQ